MLIHILSGFIGVGKISIHIFDGVEDSLSLRVHKCISGGFIQSTLLKSVDFL